MDVRNVAAIVALILVVAGFGTPVQAAQYQIDPAHTSIVFKVKHAGIGYVYGMFMEKRGSIQYVPSKPSETSIDLTVDAKSVFTGVRKRDNHLRSPDFLNVKQYPKITFNSTSVKPLGDTGLQVTGDFTLHGITRSLTTTVKLTGSGKGPQGKFRRGFKTSFTINRMEYDVDYMPDALGKDVKIIFSGEAIRQ